jgi:RNA polymerase subunit RPABC4/transcription elongation factor Spt4
MDQKDCNITITEEGKKITVVYNDYMYAAGKLPEKTIETDELIIETIERFNEWAAKYDSYCGKEDLKVLGLHLYRLLFNEEIRDKFNKAIENSEKKQSNLRLRLNLVFEESAKRFSLLPWEFLFLPDKHDGLEGEFLAEKTDLILTRFLPLPNVIKLAPDPGDTPVRILIVSSHPTRSNGKFLDKIIDDDFIEYFKKLKSKNIRVEHLADPNLEQLQEFIQGGEDENAKKTEGFVPHIFHFIGHGEAGRIALKKSREDIIKDIPKEQRHLVDPDQEDDAEWIGGDVLTNIFKSAKPKFVFLNACNAAKSEYKGYNYLSNSIAQVLSNSKIPAVLAMQYEISNDDASNFAKKVYSEIIAGTAIDQAVKNGILELGSKMPVWNHPRFGIPVFYLGAKDTTFLTITPSLNTETERKDTQKEVDQIACPTCSKLFSSRYEICPKCQSPYIFCINSSCREPLPVDATICPVCKTTQEINQGYSSDEGIKRQATYKMSGSRETGSSEISSIRTDSDHARSKGSLPN